MVIPGKLWFSVRLVGSLALLGLVVVYRSIRDIDWPDENQSPMGQDDFAW